MTPVSWAALALSAAVVPSSLETFSDEVAAIGKRISPAVAFVSVEKTVPQGLGGIDPLERFFGIPGGGDESSPEVQKGVGSGFILDLDRGYLMTNHHVVEGADAIDVKLANGDTTEGKVVGRDPNTDLAVIKLGKFRKDGLASLTFADSDKVQVGELAIAVGAPFGLEASMSLGIVSAVGRGSLGITELGDFLQTDAAINPGNSGGPLLNARGEVIGVNTAIFSQTGGSSGIGFAIPANLARLVGERLIRDGRVRRGYMGASLQPLDQGLRQSFGVPTTTAGVVVASVVEGSPAANAGLLPGDVVTAVDRRPVDTVSELVNWIAFQEPGKVVRLDVLRASKERKIDVKLEEWPAAKSESPVARDEDVREGFGLVLARVTDEVRQRFNITSREAVLVARVGPGSAADRAGIQAGDGIVAVDGNPVPSPERFKELTKNKGQVLVRIERDGRFFFASLKRTEGMSH